MNEIIYPNPWVSKKYKEGRFRSDIGTVKTRFTQQSNRGFCETEDVSFIRGYRKAINDIKLLNKNKGLAESEGL